VPANQATIGLKPVMTTFEQGLHYQQSQISFSASASKEKRFIVSDGTNKYVVYAKDEDNNGVFDAIEVQRPHELLGQRGYGFLLAGTLTTLGDNVGFNVAGKDDVIVTGNINLDGQNSALSLQSDRWVYLEGAAKVSGDFLVRGGLRAASGGSLLTDPGVFPPATNGGTAQPGANTSGVSVFVHPTAQINTLGAGTDIALHGGQDVIVNGRVTAGGVVGVTGVTWLGSGDSTVTISAGQRVAVDSAVAAAKSVKVLTTGAPGAGDQGVAFKLGSAGGINVAGQTANDSGGLIDIDVNGHVELVGALLSGGTVKQVWNGSKIVSETVEWSSEPSTLRVVADGQLYLGGSAPQQGGGTVDVGGSLRASQLIELTGGTDRNADGLGVKMPGSARVVANNPDSRVTIRSLDQNGDADLGGLIVAGGTVQDVYRDGDWVGTEVKYSEGESEIAIEAVRQVRLGRDLYAGSLIDVRGGIGSVVPTRSYADQGIVVLSSAGLRTGLNDSTINLSASGNLTVLPPTHTKRLQATGFIESAKGITGGDIKLAIWVDLGTHQVEGLIEIPRSLTTDNVQASNLLTDIRGRLYAANAFKVVSSLSGTPTVGSSQTLNSDLLEIGQVDGQLRLTSYYNFKILRQTQAGQTQMVQTSGADRLGFVMPTSGDLAAIDAPYSVDASMPGSVVNLGKPGTTGGKIIIEGSVLGHDAVNLNAGTNSTGDKDVTLGVLGVIETRSGNIALNPGGPSVFQGKLIARGDNADIIINASKSIEVRGSLIANRDIVLRAGTNVVSGETSVWTRSSSSFQSEGSGGRVVIAGLNDVRIDSSIGTQSPNLALIDVIAERGTLTVEANAGRIESAGQISLRGLNVQINGPITSTRNTASTTDFEIDVLTTGALGVGGTISAVGSVQMKAAGDLTLRNAMVTSTGNSQRMRFEAAGSLYMGNTQPTLANINTPMAVILEADQQIELIAGQTLQSGVDAEVYTRGADPAATTGSRILLQGKAIAWGGLAMAGADYSYTNGAASRTWTGKDSLLEIRADTSARMGGGKRLDNGSLVAAGANLWSSGTVRIRGGTDSAGIGVSLAAPSSIVADAKFNPIWSGTPDGSIDIFAEGQVQLSGALEARDAGADISIVSGSLVLVDATISAADQLSVRAGTHSSGQGIVQTPVVRDGSGNVISGGVLDTQLNGKITLRSVDSMLLRGLVGQVVTSAARTAIVDAEASAGDITVTGLIDARAGVSLVGRQVNLLPGSHAFANNSGSDTYLRGRESILVAGEGPQQLEAMVKGDLLAHLAAPTITITGIVEATGANGRVLLNAGEQLRVNGRVKAMATGGKIVMQAGVDQSLSRATLEAQGLPVSGAPITVLQGGFLQVMEQGLILSDTDVVMRSGGDVMLQADPTVKGEKTILVPQIAVRNESVNVVVGSVQVDVGTIQVPRITYVTTTSIEQIGEARVKVGSESATMDVT
ncbi:MAG: hypothetical protein RL322_1, partial [Pseudomonadota bacterium]